MPTVKDDGQGRRPAAKLRPGHKMSRSVKDDQGRYFAGCSCGETLRAATPNKLSDAVIEHLVDRGNNADQG
jgi:hypothetical protein